MEHGRICIFAKAPTPGRVKTRLAAALGANGAADLARAFLVDTCAAARTVPGASAILAIDGQLDDALVVDLCAVDPALLAVRLWPQGEGDLGARLERVIGRALAEAPFAIAIGTDSPGLPARLLTAARDALATSDAAIGPAFDGGFYLLALRRCPPGLLVDLPWSRGDTFAHTFARLLEHGLSVSVLEPWFDVDRPEDLARLLAHVDAGTIVAPATARVLERRRESRTDRAERSDRRRPIRISVVMPVLDEQRRIERALADVLAVPDLHEVIVVDGGSTDRTVALARAFAAGSPGTHGVRVRVLETPRGRALQMNAGAAVATGEVLLFLHADTTLPHDAARHVEQVLVNRGVVAGAFRTWTVADEPRPWFAPALHAADLRSRYTRLPYGDQAMFVRADAFARVGGFPNQPLMEDLALAQRLSRLGAIQTADATVRVSGRRFVARPIFYTVAVNLFPLLYRIGVRVDRLARLYEAVR